MIAALRSLAFYASFYFGSIVYTAGSLIVLPFSASAFRTVVRGWARYQRGCAKALLGITVREEGARPAGPALYAMKHESFFEAIDLPALFDQPVVFAKEELFAIPLWGRAALAFGLIPVARDQGPKELRAMLGGARAMSASGRPLVIFPEGTRVPHGERAPLRSGFAGLYKLLGLPVVPVAVDSGPLYHRLWKRRGTITVRFGEIIPPGLPREEVEARVHAAINALNG